MSACKECLSEAAEIAEHLGSGVVGAALRRLSVTAPTRLPSAFELELAAFDARVAKIGQALVTEATSLIGAAGMAPVQEGPVAVTCRNCPRKIRAHIVGLCLVCWRQAGQPDGVVEAVE